MCSIGCTKGAIIRTGPSKSNKVYQKLFTHSDSTLITRSFILYKRMGNFDVCFLIISIIGMMCMKGLKMLPTIRSISNVLLLQLTILRLLYICKGITTPIDGIVGVDREVLTTPINLSSIDWCSNTYLTRT